MVRDELAEFTEPSLSWTSLPALTLTDEGVLPVDDDRVGPASSQGPTSQGPSSHWSLSHGPPSQGSSSSENPQSGI